MELPAFLSAVAMRVRHWLVCSATSASSAPTGPVPETWMWLPMRTAREKPMMGSKGEVPGMLVRLVMRVRCLADMVPDRAGPFFHFGEQGKLAILPFANVGDNGSLRRKDLFRRQGKVTAQGTILGFDGRESLGGPGENFVRLLYSVARRDVLRTVSVFVSDAYQ